MTARPGRRLLNENRGHGPKSSAPSAQDHVATRRFHLNNRNIDRRLHANTAEFTRTGHGCTDPADLFICPIVVHIPRQSLDRDSLPLQAVDGGRCRTGQDWGALCCNGLAVDGRARSKESGAAIGARRPVTARARRLDFGPRALWSLSLRPGAGAPARRRNGVRHRVRFGRSRMRTHS